MLVAEMLAIHFCSDRRECIAVLTELLDEVRRRVSGNLSVLPEDAARIFIVNPATDMRLMNLLEDCGGRVCGTEYLFSHALDEIPTDVEPMESLARMMMSDTMIGPASQRADRICRDISAFGAEGVLIARIPGASHCAIEGAIITSVVRTRLGLPVVEVEVPPVIDAFIPTIRTRIEGLVETVKFARKK
ncbi:MAG TPA: 2-hydroxyacyl-CoA dehydratase [Phycisphaerae bacterium]|nr:2-hydroxyacyl-CoA dehydratase [Phycisphaerae bacterium]